MGQVGIWSSAKLFSNLGHLKGRPKFGATFGGGLVPPGIESICMVWAALPQALLVVDILRGTHTLPVASLRLVIVGAAFGSSGRGRVVP